MGITATAVGVRHLIRLAPGKALPFPALHLVICFRFSDFS